LQRTDLKACSPDSKLTNWADSARAIDQRLTVWDVTVSADAKGIHGYCPKSAYLLSGRLTLSSLACKVFVHSGVLKVGTGFAARLSGWRVALLGGLLSTL